MGPLLFHEKKLEGGLVSGVLFHYVKRQFGPTTLEIKKLGGGLKSGVLFHYVKANWTYYFIIKKIGGWCQGFHYVKKKPSGLTAF